MLKTIAAGLIVTAVIAGAAAAQPSDSTNSTPTTATTKHPGIRSNTKSTSRLKQTSTTKTEQIAKHTGKPSVHRRPRHQVVHHRGSGLRHLVGRYRTLSPHRHPAASTTSQHTQSNGSHKAPQIESNTNTQK
jgi:hypothetical protein